MCPVQASQQLHSSRDNVTLRLPSAMRRRRLQSPQKALVMEVTKDTVPRKPGTRKFFATSPRASCKKFNCFDCRAFRIR